MKSKQQNPFEPYLKDLPLLLLAILSGLLAWCYWHVFAGEPCGDDNTHHLSEIARLAQAMKHGDWNWWNPSSNAGFPSGYYYQVLPQAVPAALSAILGITPLTAFQIGIFVPLVLAPAAVYRALRVWGATPWVALGAAAMVPFAIGNPDMPEFNNQLARWGQSADGTFWVGLYTQLWACVAFPLAFAYAVKWIEKGEKLGPAIGWGAFVFLSHPFIGVALGVGLTAGSGVVTVLEIIGRRTWWKPALRLSILGGALVLAASSVWLPVIADYQGFGGFPHRVVDEVGPGFRDAAVWLVSGKFLDDSRALPCMTMLLPLVAVFARGRWMIWLGASALLYFLFLGAGPHLPKVGGHDDLLPAARYLPTLQIALAMLAGGGLASMVERAWHQKSSYQVEIRIASIAGAAAVTLFIVLWGAGQQHAGARVAADFGEGIDIDDMLSLMPAIQALPPGRIQARGGAGSHWAVSLPTVYADRDVFLVMGGAALQSSLNYDYAYEMRDEDAKRAAWIFDAPYILLKAEQSDKVPGEIVAQGNTYEVHELPAPGLVGPIQVIGSVPPGDREETRKRIIAWVWSNDAMKDKFLAHDGSGGESPAPNGRTLGYDRKPSEITAEVEADGDQPTTFVIRETWHPRWTATLDGKPVTIRRVTPDFMAIDVPPGQHTIDLQFDRPLWTWLLWLLWPLGVFAPTGVEAVRSRLRAARATPASAR